MIVICDHWFPVIVLREYRVVATVAVVVYRLGGDVGPGLGPVAVVVVMMTGRVSDD